MQRVRVARDEAISELITPAKNPRACADRGFKGLLHIFAILCAYRS
jgi:hypothetical protein